MMSEEGQNMQGQIVDKKKAQLEAENVEHISQGQKYDDLQNKQPYIYTDNGISDDELQLNFDDKEERLAEQNKRYIQMLKKASALFHENQSKEYLIKKKQADLKQQRSRLEHLRNEHQRNVIRKKEALTSKRLQLEKTIGYQIMRIGDLTQKLQLLKQLNSYPITQVPPEIEVFKQFIAQQYSRMKQSNIPQKVHCILDQQDILLDNLMSINEQLIKE